ncbi:MAG TPA: DUF5335 family protein [Thermoanaerobaculia bacterium]|nr:DUF5335 family protein [Thermoanaerobaculia bacterium]
MKTTAVVPYEWAVYFDEFSRRHRGWLVQLTILDPKLGAQVEARDVALQGIVADPRVREVTFLLGEPAQLAEHAVRRVARAWVELGDDDTVEAVQIEADDGTRAILQFRVAVLPELVDGISPASRAQK